MPRQEVEHRAHALLRRLVGEEECAEPVHALRGHAVALEERAPFVSDVLKNATSPGTGIFVSAPVLRGDAVVPRGSVVVRGDAVVRVAAARVTSRGDGAW